MRLERVSQTTDEGKTEGKSRRPPARHEHPEERGRSLVTRTVRSLTPWLPHAERSWGFKSPRWPVYDPPTHLPRCPAASPGNFLELGSKVLAYRIRSLLCHIVRRKTFRHVSVLRQESRMEKVKRTTECWLAISVVRCEHCHDGIGGITRFRRNIRRASTITSKTRIPSTSTSVRRTSHGQRRQALAQHGRDFGARRSAASYRRR